MAGYDNVKNKGFDKRTTDEQREIAKLGGKASGVSRRRKADFNRTLNMLLTAEIDSPKWKPLLDALGIDSTLESAILMAQIQEAISGSTKAAYFIARYAGQSDKTEDDKAQQLSKTEYIKARTEELKDLASEAGCEDDGFVEALNGSAVKDWGDENE